MGAEDQDQPRPLETEVMALLEQMIVEAEAAQALIQDDSRVTGEADRRGILDHLMKIRSLAMDVERALGPKILKKPGR